MASACSLALGLAGCGGDAGGERAPLAPTATPATAAATTALPANPAGGAPYIGSLAVDPADGSLLVGTGAGLYTLEPGRMRAKRFDGKLTTPDGSGRIAANLVLRFSGPGKLLASGHPAPGSALPENLGLIASQDGGTSWKPVSLLGRADLHALEVRGGVVVGASAEKPSLLVSRDGGRSFQERTAPGLALDADVDPANGDRIVITTDAGVFVSSDAGGRWRQRDALSGRTHLAWSASGPLFRFEAGGAVSVSEDGGETWRQRGDAGGSATTVTIDRRGRLYAALPGAVIVRSSDGGRTFAELTRLTS